MAIIARGPLKLRARVCLTCKITAEELYRDFEADQKGRSDNGPKELKTRLERDIEAYQRCRQI